MRRQQLLQFLLTTKSSTEIAKLWRRSVLLKAKKERFINKLKGVGACAVCLCSTALFPINIKNQGEKFRTAYLAFFNGMIQFFHPKHNFSSTSPQHCDNFWKAQNQNETFHLNAFSSNFPFCLKMQHGSYSCSSQALFLLSPTGHPKDINTIQSIMGGWSLDLWQQYFRQVHNLKQELSQWHEESRLKGNTRKKQNRLARSRRKEYPFQKEAAIIVWGLSPEVTDKCVWFKFQVAEWEHYVTELKH